MSTAWSPSYAERAAGIVKAYVESHGEQTVTSDDLLDILEWIHIRRAYDDELGRYVLESIATAFGGPPHRFGTSEDASD